MSTGDQQNALFSSAGCVTLKIVEDKIYRYIRTTI